MIADRVRNICPTPQNLHGNAAIENINPKLIVFDDSTIKHVIPKFGDLIIANNFHLAEKKIYKAVGWVGKPNTRRTLPSYFDSFGLLGGKQKQDYASLSDYLKVACENQRSQSISIKSKLIIAAILKSLRLLGIKKDNNVPYTETSFIELIGKEKKDLYDELNLKLLQWCQELSRNQDISVDLRDFIRAHICAQFGVSINPELQAFLEAPATTQLALEHQSDTYVHETENHKISIDVCNVHSVKGETHTATLYLETFYIKYDMQSILEYMKGNHTPPRGATLQNALKMAYVGMTRPTHMLCVAAHKDSCEPNLDELSAVGWDIHRIFEV